MKISVVISTYNRAESLSRCLATLFEQDFSCDRFEVIVVVDGSSDETIGMLSSLRPRNELVVVALEETEAHRQLKMLVHAVRAVKSSCFWMMICPAIADFYRHTLRHTQMG